MTQQEIRQCINELTKIMRNASSRNEYDDACFEREELLALEEEIL